MSLRASVSGLLTTPGFSCALRGHAAICATVALLWDRINLRSPRTSLDLGHTVTSSPVVLPWTTFVAAAVRTHPLTRYFSSQSDSKGMVNLEINKDSTKVVHSFDLEDISKKAIYCRCWRSKKFPYCDGSHTKHNKETGDNVGPLIIKKRDV